MSYTLETICSAIDDKTAKIIFSHFFTFLFIGLFTCSGHLYLSQMESKGVCDICLSSHIFIKICILKKDRHEICGTFRFQYRKLPQPLLRKKRFSLIQFKKNGKKFFFSIFFKLY